MARRRRKTPSYKLPDSALTPTQLRNRQMIRRRRAQDRDPLYNPSAPLAGRNLASAVDRIVAGQFDPVERGYKQDIKDTTTQGTALMGRAQDYYRQLAEQERRGIQTQAALGSMLNQRLDTVGQQAAQAAEAAKSAEQQRLGQDEAVRGPGLQDTSTLNEIATLRANAAQNQQAASTEAALGTSNWANFANALSQARGLRGGEVQERLGNRMLNQNRKTQDALGDLAVKRGGARADTLMRLRQQGFENLATQQTLGLKEADLGLEATRVKTQAELARERLRTQREIARRAREVQRAGQLTAAEQRRLDRESRENIARWRIDARDNPDGSPAAGLTPNQRVQRSDKLRDKVELAVTMYQRYLEQRGNQPAATRAMRHPNNNVPRYLINYARDLTSKRTGGRLSPRNYRDAVRRGLIVPPEWRPRRRKG